MNEEKHQYYPDPRPSHEELMEAFGILFANNPEIFQPDDKNQKPTVMSMPNIYEAAKKTATGPNSGVVKRKEMLKNIAGIYENAHAKEDGLNVLNKLKLPRYKKIKTTVKEFLKRPEQFLNSLHTDRYFPSVMDLKTGERHFDLNLTDKQVSEFLRNLLESGKISKDHLLILSEYRANCFSGNIIINPLMEDNNENSESIQVELVEGTHTGLAYMGSSPIVKSANNWFGKFKPEILLEKNFSALLMEKLSKETPQNGYIDFQSLKKICEAENIADEDREKLSYYQRLVEKVVEVLSLIPRNMDLFYNCSVSGEAFFPGYYEFILSEPVKKDKCRNQSEKDCEPPQQDADDWIKSMEICFLDYRKADHYSDLQHHYLFESDETIA